MEKVYKTLLHTHGYQFVDVSQEMIDHDTGVVHESYRYADKPEEIHLDENSVAPLYACAYRQHGILVE